MESKGWYEEFQRVDSTAPSSETKGETPYTLYSRDFQEVPLLDYAALSKVDPAVLVLMN